MSEITQAYKTAMEKAGFYGFDVEDLGNYLEVFFQVFKELEPHATNEINHLEWSIDTIQAIEE